jgi:signal transduction histidine kinase
VAAVSAAAGKPAQFKDETVLGRLNQALGTHSKSIVALTLIGEDGPLGMLMLGTGAQPQFSEEEKAFLQLIADRAATVILHARLFEQISAGRARAQVLSQQLMAAQEAERRHLARELHDEVGQALTAIKINLQSTQTAQTVAAMTGRLDEGIAMVDQAIQQVRNLSLDLRPSLLDDLGLVAALRWYLDRQAQRVGYTAELIVDPPGIRASASLETACFRVVQEALTNIARHAQARNVRVELRRPRTELELLISDDGVGFDVAAARQRAARGASLGLLGMQERVLLSGGKIEFVSTPGQGTRIVARLPLSAQPAVERRRKRRLPP